MPCSQDALTGVVINYVIPPNYVVDDILVSGVFYVVGQGFIRLMRMLVVPLVFCSIVCGSMAVGDTKKLGNVGVKTLIFYLCTTALAITVALTVANFFNPGKGLDMSKIQITSTVQETTQSTSITETLLKHHPGEHLRLIKLRRYAADHRVCIDPRCDPRKHGRPR